jgi:hypothetical protein
VSYEPSAPVAYFCSRRALALVLRASLRYGTSSDWVFFYPPRLNFSGSARREFSPLCHVGSPSAILAWRTPKFGSALGGCSQPQPLRVDFKMRLSIRVTDLAASETNGEKAVSIIGTIHL